jgi:hypothetical protein
MLWVTISAAFLSNLEIVVLELVDVAVHIRSIPIERDPTYFGEVT